MNQQFRNITYLSDRSGTGDWRHIWPINSINCVAQNTGIQSDYSQTPILEPRYYQDVNSITIQRWISPQQREIFDKLLKPCMESNRGYLIYAIDDLMTAQDIPLFNRGRKSFEPDEVQADIKHMLNESDYVFVTTDYIKKCYNKYYGVPLENIVAIPNFLPRYLFCDRYDKNRKLDQFKHFKNKPRIGIVSSLSHYNIDDVRVDKDGLACRKEPKKDQNNNEIKDEKGNVQFIWKNEKGIEVNESEISVIKDDLDIIIDMIRETVDDFQWVFFGFCPPKLEDLVKKGKIECHGGVPIMNFPSKYESLCLQAVVAPIQDIEFNRCKSFIKYMESACMGVPLFASRALPYTTVMDDSQLFDDAKELKDKLMKLKFSSVGLYEKTIEKQWKWLNSPCHEGDFDIRNFWLEDNLNIFVDMYRLRRRGIESSLSAYLQFKEQNEKSKMEQTIFSNDNGVEILK